MWERFSLPIAVSGASAHPPQAPIWLDPSGCPPGRVFYFGLRAPVNSRENPDNYGLCVKIVEPRWTSQNFSTKYSGHISLIRCVAVASVSPHTGRSMTHRNDATSRVLDRWRLLAEQR